MSTVSELQALSGQAKQVDDMLSYLKSKLLHSFLAIRKKPVTGSFDLLAVTKIVQSFFHVIGC